MADNKNEKGNGKINGKNGKNGKVVGSIFFVNFHNKLVGYERSQYENVLKEQKVFYLCKLSSRAHTFFIPAICDQDAVMQKLHQIGARLTKTDVHEKDSDFIRKSVIEWLIEQFNDLKTAAEETKLVALRVNRVNGMIRRFYELKDFAEFYSRLFNFQTNILNDRINAETKDLKQMVVRMTV